MKRPKTRDVTVRSGDYEAMLSRVVGLIGEARRASARAVNSIMTATYWLIGRHVVEFEQQGKLRAQYGEQLLTKLAADLKARCGRGFEVDNLQRMRLFYFAYPKRQIYATPSRNSLRDADSAKSATLSRKSNRFRLPIFLRASLSRGQPTSGYSQ